MQNEKWGYNTLWAKIGKNYSTAIYIFHVIFIAVCSQLFSEAIYAYLAPFIVFAVTCVFSMFFKYIKSKSFQLARNKIT